MKYKLACFDLDGTIIDETIYIWQTIHEHLATDEHKREDAKKRFYSKEISYEEWAIHDVELWKEVGAKKKDILAALSQLRLMKGARETLSELKNKGMKLAIISGSLNIAIEKVLPDYEQLFDYVHINKMYFDKQGNIAGLKATEYDLESKGEALKKICKKEGIKPEQTVFVGDNFNDISAAKQAGLAISFNSKSEELNAVSDVIIKKKDLREVLEFV